MKHYLHVGFAFAGKQKISELVPAFDKAEAWLRYAPNCWIIWTSESPQTWDTRLKALLGPKDIMLICPIDISVRSGWLVKEMWDWLGTPRA
jgi:hypothetical protein